MVLPEDLLRSQAIQTDSRLILVVIDGLGGLPLKGKTELEAAKTPNLGRLASKSICGLMDPISYGITPGRRVPFKASVIQANSKYQIPISK